MGYHMKTNRLEILKRNLTDRLSSHAQTARVAKENGDSVFLIGEDIVYLIAKREYKSHYENEIRGIKRIISIQFGIQFGGYGRAGDYATKSIKHTEIEVGKPVVIKISIKPRYSHLKGFVRKLISENSFYIERLGLIPVYTGGSLARLETVAPVMVARTPWANDASMRDAEDSISKHILEGLVQLNSRLETTTEYGFSVKTRIRTGKLIDGFLSADRVSVEISCYFEKD